MPVLMVCQQNPLSLIICLAELQVIKLLHDAFEAAGLNLYLRPYGCLPTGYECGIIEVRAHAATSSRQVLRCSSIEYWQETLHVRYTGAQALLDPLGRDWTGRAGSVADSLAGVHPATHVTGCTTARLSATAPPCQSSLTLYRVRQIRAQAPFSNHCNQQHCSCVLVVQLTLILHSVQNVMPSLWYLLHCRWCLTQSHERPLARSATAAYVTSSAPSLALSAVQPWRGRGRTSSSVKQPTQLPATCCRCEA